MVQGFQEESFGASIHRGICGNLLLEANDLGVVLCKVAWDLGPNVIGTSKKLTGIVLSDLPFYAFLPKSQAFQ
jgi:hypothetical protein